MKIEVYTNFGRVLKTFPVPQNQIHHLTLEDARAYALKLSCDWWIRII